MKFSFHLEKDVTEDFQVCVLRDQDLEQGLSMIVAMMKHFLGQVIFLD